MKRRSFIKNLCKALPVLAIVPVVLSEAIKPKAKQVIVFEVPLDSGKQHWLDLEEYQAMLKWEEDQMRKLNTYLYRTNGTVGN